MGRGVVPFPHMHLLPSRCAALRNPGHGSCNLSRKAKPSVAEERKATSFSFEIARLPSNFTKGGDLTKLNRREFGCKGNVL